MNAEGVICSGTATALTGMPLTMPRIMVEASACTIGLLAFAASCSTVVEPLPSRISTSRPSSR
jgi:hypothetical protein